MFWIGGDLVCCCRCDDVQGNQASDLFDHIVSTSGGVVERPFEDSLLER